MDTDQDNVTSVVDGKAEADYVGPRKRLMMKSIRMENFKSYAGVQEIGPFHKCFSAIVGPNGSGKSNVIDALLFVFGKASKKLRSKKLGELVHQSERYPDVPGCRVTVRFHEIIDTGDGADDYEVVSDSEVEISRTANRATSASKYYLQGRPSSLKDVTTFLRDKGVDLDHNRFLILQGEVEQISLMKPKAVSEHDEGLLEYLEDIIGSNQYVQAIEERYTKVEELNDERNRSLNSVKLVERELAGLSGAKDEAKQFLERRLALYKEKNVLNQINLHETESAARTMREEATEAAERMAEAQKEANQAEEARAAHAESYRADEKASTDIERKLVAAKKQLDALERQEVKTAEDQKNAASREKQLAKALAKDTAERARLRAALERHEEDVQDSQKEIDRLTKQLAKQEKELDDIYKSETADLQAQLAKAREQLAPLSLAENEAQAAFDLVDQELKLLETRAGAAQKRVDDARASLQQLKAKQKSRAGDIEKAQAEIAAIDKRLPEIREELRQSEARESELKAAADAAAGRLAESASSMSEAKSQNKLMSALFKARDKGLIDGIHGRLGDLGWIDKQYDVAISTACPQLHNVVVDTTEAATKCLRLLRKYELGVATFIVLDKLPQYVREKCEAPCDTPGNVPRLFDLVQGVTDERYRWAFYHALRDTLVAPTLDAANKLAFGGGKSNQRWRVVTVQGQLIDTSGTMSGGGTRVFRGAMALSASEMQKPSASSDGSTVSAAELASLKQEAEATAAELAEFRQRLSDLEDEAADLDKQRKLLARSVPKMELDMKALPTQISELEQQLPLLEKELKQSGDGGGAEAKRLQSLRSDAADRAKELAAIREQTAPLEAEIDRVEKQILESGGVKMKVGKAKVDSTTEQIEAEEARKTKAEVGLKAVTKQLKKLETKVAKSEKAQADLESEVQGKADETGELAEKLASARAEVKNLSIQVDELAEQLTEKRSEHARLTSAEQSKRKLELDAKAEAEALEAKAKEADKQARHWRNQIKELEAKFKRQVEDIREMFEQSSVVAAAPGPESQPGKNGAAAGADNAVDNGDADEDDLPESALGPESIVGTGELPVYETVEQLQAVGSVKEVKRRINSIEEELTSMKPNMGAIQQWQTKERVFRQRSALLAQATKRRDEARAELDSLRKRRLDEFMAGFSTISMKLKEMYQMITLGGDAELELVDTLDPFSEGVVFSVRPPKKSWKNIVNLSGGEKTLSSLALVFALQTYRPCALYLMDEIDAALDFKNVSIIANYISERAKDTQFTVISLRNYMFEKANRLVGIYKVDDCTRSVTIDPASFSAAATASTSHRQKQVHTATKENEQNTN